MKISRQTSTSVYVTAALAILVIGFMPLAFHVAYAAATSQTGLIIPLYAYPTDSSWSGLIHAKESYPNVPVIAVVSPTSSGPGSYDSNFASGIAKLQAAGIVVVGYINTQYGGLGMGTLKSWISDYQNWYSVDGVFLDSMANWGGEESYYSTASNYAYSIGLSLTVGNPGASVPSSYSGTANIIVIYENPGNPSISTLSSSTFGNNPSAFGMMAYNVGKPSQSYLSNVAQYTGWVYFTDAGNGDPYQSLPSYLNSMMSMLSSMDAGGNGSIVTATSSTSSTTSSTSNPVNNGGGSSQLTVDSENTLGNPVTGYYTVLYNSGGGALGTGYTPSAYTLNNGVTYQIEADNYGPCSFSYWSGGGLGGSTQDPARITIDGPTTIYAVYSGSSCGAQSSNPSPPGEGPSGNPSLVVDSVDQNGNTITGYYATLRSSSGKLISTGYTGTTFTDVTAGTKYQVELDSYASCQFQYWQGSGSATDPLPFTQSAGQMTVVGVYDCSSGGSVGGGAAGAAGGLGSIGILLSTLTSDFGMTIALIASALASIVVRAKVPSIIPRGTSPAV
jgi:hypothetical protein